MANLRHGAQAAIGAKSTLMATLEAAFKSEWELRQPDIPLKEDKNREIMFAAIAQGVLRYLEANQSRLNTNSVNGGSSHSHHLEFTVE